MSERRELVLSFDNSNDAEANRLAQALQDELDRSGIQVSARRHKPRNDTQDFGTTLVLVFGTPVAIALANGVSNFLKRHSGSSITIYSDGTVLASNLNAGEAPRIAAAFGHALKKS